MKAKYKKFNQYFKGWYFDFKIGYCPFQTWEATRLRHSQINVDFSYKMKNLKENRKQIKYWRDFHHRIKQKEQRILRESRKQFIGVLEQ